MLIRDLLENGNPTHQALGTDSAPPLTYRELGSQVDALAEQLDQIGLGQGDRIAMALPNGLEVISLFLAASTVGTAAPLNPAYTRDEFKFYLGDTSARALIVPARGGEEARAAAEDDTVIVETNLDNGRVRLSASGNTTARQPRDGPDNIALI